MRLLLHTCCAPCVLSVRKAFLERGFEVVGFFFNPNIHPYLEYRRRMEALKSYAGREGFPVVYADDYDLEGFLRRVVHNESERCRLCYGVRLEETAKTASEQGFDCFSSTLLVSPHQKHDVVRRAGEAAGAQWGVAFCYVDFRPAWRAAMNEAQRRRMYLQQYCGCVYSEKERYFRKPKGG